MPDVEARISLVTTGGDASANEIKKAGDAINSVTSSSTNLQARFQERFQHIGLMLFAGQAMQSIGLAGETRQAVLLMNTALMGAEAAAGLSSGGLTLLITILVALAAAVYKVSTAHKDESETVQKSIDQTQQSIDTYQKEIDQLNKFQQAGGSLNKALADLLKADQLVANDLKSNLHDAQQKEITLLQEQQAALQRSADMHAAFAKVMDYLKTIIMEMLKPLTALVGMTQSLGQYFDSMLPSVTKHVALTGELKTKYDELDAKIASLKADHKAFSDSAISDLDKQKQRMDMLINEYVTKMQDSAQAMEDSQSKELEFWDKQIDKMTKDQQKQLDEQVRQAKTAADKIGSDFGTMVSDMLVKGESFTQAFQNMFQQMAEQIISWIMKMIAEWAIFTAMSAMGGPLGSVGAAGLSGMGFATGGSVFADSPTLALFGEGGPEMATFTPMSGGGEPPIGGGGGGDMYNSITVNVQGVVDQNMVNKIGQTIVEQIRGMGQINFSR